MSRQQKKHKPIKGSFNDILGAVAMGSGMAKKAAKQMQRDNCKPAPKKP